MSFFLGPIHHWMFNKIKIAEAREAFIASECTKKYGDEAQKIAGEALEKYGDYISKPLESLVEGKPIHGTLNELIDVAATREAALVSGLVGKFGDEAKDAVYKASYDHGKMTALDAGKTGTAPADSKEAFKLLFDWILDAMPCDRVLTVDDDRKTNVSWKMAMFHLQDSFKRGGSDVPTQARVIMEWKRGFVEGLGNGFEFSGDLQSDGSIACRIGLSQEEKKKVIVESGQVDMGMVVNHVIAKWPQTLPVFNRYGLDTCCGGAETIEINAKSQKLKPEKLDSLVQELNELIT